MLSVRVQPQNLQKTGTLKPELPDQLGFDGW